MICLVSAGSSSCGYIDEARLQARTYPKFASNAGAQQVEKVEIAVPSIKHLFREFLRLEIAVKVPRAKICKESSSCIPTLLVSQECKMLSSRIMNQ